MVEKFIKYVFTTIFLLGVTNLSAQNIINVRPQPNRVDVPTDTVIAVQFDTEMNPTTINANTFVVSGAMSGTLSGNYNYSSGSKTAVFTPDSSYKAGETIYITLTTEIQTSTGVSLNLPFYWSFTTKVGSGTGLFTLTSRIEFYWEDPVAVVSGDFNGDGDLDIAMTFGGALKVLFNDGYGSFIPGENMTVGGNDVVAADFDGDGDLDIAVATYSNAIAILINDGSGQFTQSPMIAVVFNPDLLFSNDIDGDGDFDLMTFSEYDYVPEIPILINDGNGNFSWTDTINLGYCANDIAGGDFDNDGDLDLAVSFYKHTMDSISILSNDGYGNFVETHTLSIQGWRQWIESGDLNGDGWIDLVVTCQSPWMISVLINDGSGVFQDSTISLFDQQWPEDIIIHDFDNDEDLDLCIEVGGTPPGFLFLTNDGNANFTENSIVGTGYEPKDMTAGDYNNDGDLDLATTYLGGYSNRETNALFIYKNRDRIQDIALSSELLNFETIKMDSSKNLHFIIYNWGVDSTLQVSNVLSSNSVFVPNATSLNVLPGDSAIVSVNFTPAQMLSYADSLLIINNDPGEPQKKLYLQGKGDPVVGVTPPNNALNIIENPEISAIFKIPMDPLTINPNTFIVSGSETGLHSGTYAYDDAANTATFSPDNTFKAGEVVNVSLSDKIQNSSGQKMPNIYGWDFTVSAVDGSATFGFIDTIGDLGGQINAMVTGDFDNDMDIDLVLLNGAGNMFGFLKNNGNGSFSQIDIPVGEDEKYYITSGDFDNDGYLDLAVVFNTEHSVSILKNDGLGYFTESSAVGVGYVPCMIVTGFFNCDGYLDLAVANSWSNNVSILINDGTGVFSEASTPRVGEKPHTIISDDWDNDGDTDLAVAHDDESAYIILLKNDGYGSFIETSKIWLRASFIASGDLNGDGYLDLAVTYNEISVLLNNGSGDFSQSTVVSAGNLPVHMTVADMEGDGDLDMVVVNYWSNNISILENNGSGGFIESSVAEVGLQPIRITSADFDTDGDMDLVTINPESGDIHILFNTNSFSSYIAFDAHKEYVDTINIDYHISNPDSNAINIFCEYSIDEGNSWNMPTIIGDTTNIQPENYQGYILWDSYTDLPGIDLQTVQFKITPYDINGDGRPYTTPPFHLDNNRLPSVSIVPVTGEQNEDVEISLQLSDLESDTLGIICEYYNLNNQNWQTPTITGNITGITNYNTQITWNSLTDLPEGVGRFPFRIIPYDNDQGSADTVIIKIDQVGAPEALILNQFTQEQSGDITIQYQLYDDENDNIDLTGWYSINSGESWFPATISGNVSGIGPANYQDSLVWHSVTDLPGVDKQTVRFKLTPFDGNYGFINESDNFHLDNNLPPSIQLGNIESPNTGFIDIPFIIYDEEQDTINLLGKYQVSGNQWHLMSIGDPLIFPANNYNDTLHWNSSNDLGFGEYENVLLQLYPIDNDTGAFDYSNQFEINNFAGDYTGDIEINYDDLLIFAQAWNAVPQDTSKEIGPASGEPPLLIPQPDGKIDFEDLVVLVRQWNWCYDNPDGFGKIIASGSLPVKEQTDPLTSQTLRQEMEKETIFEKKSPVLGNTNNFINVRDHLFCLEQSNYDPWSQQFGDSLTISLDTSVAIMGFQLIIDYDPDIFSIAQLENIFLVERNGFTFKSYDEKSGNLILNSVLLDQQNSNKYLDGLLYQIKIQSEKETRTPIELSWKVHDTSAKLITAGSENYSIAIHSSVPQHYALNQNYPNPFNPSTTIRYQLPINGKVKLEIYNILGQKIKTLVNKHQKEGYYSINWNVFENGEGLASGLYILHLKISGENGSKFVKNKKMLFIK